MESDIEILRGQCVRFHAAGCRKSSLLRFTKLNEGHVNVGIGHDIAELAVETIRECWDRRDNMAPENCI